MTTNDRHELATIIRDANCLDVSHGKDAEFLDVEDFYPEADAILSSGWLRAKISQAFCDGESHMLAELEDDERTKQCCSTS